MKTFVFNFFLSMFFIQLVIMYYGFCDILPLTATDGGNTRVFTQIIPKVFQNCLELPKCCAYCWYWWALKVIKRTIELLIIQKERNKLKQMQTPVCRRPGNEPITWLAEVITFWLLGQSVMRLSMMLKKRVASRKG